METKKVVKVKEAEITEETEAMVECLAEGYLDSYGMDVDYDKIFEFIRESNNTEEIEGYGEMDYPQMVMDKLLTMEIEPEPEVEEIVKRKIGKAGGKLDCICNISLLRNFIRKINIDNEAKLKIDEKGIGCCIVEPSHVMMVKAYIPRNEFYSGKDAINRMVHYHAENSFEVGIDLVEFDQMLRLISSGFDRIHLLIENEGIILETMNDKPLRKRMILLDTESMKVLKEPTLDLDVEATIQRSEISLLQKATSTNDTGKKVTMISDGKILTAVITDENTEGELTLTLSKNVKGKGKAIYSHEYLNKFLSSITENKPITIQYKTNNPLKIQGKLQDNGEYYCLIAPRIEE